MYLDILEQIETFFNNHSQVSEYQFGNVSDLSTVERKFPLLFLQSNESRITEYEIEYRFDIYSFTLYEQDTENLINGLNDTQLILTDFISYFKNNTEEDYWLNTDSLNLEVLTGEFDNYLVGWQLSFRFTSVLDYDSCNIPIDAGNPLDKYLMFREPFISSSYTESIDGEITDVTYENGVGSFNGTSSIVTYPGMVIEGDYTIRAKVDIKTATYNVIGGGGLIGAGSSSDGFYFGIDTRNRIERFIIVSKGNIIASTYGLTPNILNIPSDILFVISKSLNTVSFYLDGVLIESIEYTNSLDNLYCDVFTLGGINYATTYIYEQDIDLIEIYNKALTQEEIDTL